MKMPDVPETDGTGRGSRLCGRRGCGAPSGPGAPGFVRAEELLCPFAACFLHTEFLYLNRLCSAAWVHTCLSDFWLNFHHLLYVSLIHVILKFHDTCCSPPHWPSVSRAHSSQQCWHVWPPLGCGRTNRLGPSIPGLCYAEEPSPV